MTIFELDETVCSRENNRCKRRNKCRRYLSPRDCEWEADYYANFQQFCDYFIPQAQEEKEEEKKRLMAEIRQATKD